MNNIKFRNEIPFNKKSNKKPKRHLKEILKPQFEVLVKEMAETAHVSCLTDYEFEKEKLWELFINNIKN